VPPQLYVVCNTLGVGAMVFHATSRGCTPTPPHGGVLSHAGGETRHSQPRKHAPNINDQAWEDKGARPAIVMARACTWRESFAPIAARVALEVASCSCQAVHKHPSCVITPHSGHTLLLPGGEVLVHARRGHDAAPCHSSWCSSLRASRATASPCTHFREKTATYESTQIFPLPTELQ
jgi:hypothetical protein